MAEEIRDSVKSLKIGEKIASLRKSKGLSVQVLAEKCDLQDIVVSQIESNTVSPPVAVLLKIAKVFDKQLSYFFEGEEGTIKLEVVRYNEGKVVQRKRASGESTLSYSYRSLSCKKSNKHMQPFLVEFELDISEKLELLTHEGEEFLYLLDGELDMHTDEEVINLKNGDSVYFESSIPHAFVGKGKVKPKALVSIYTPDGCQS